MYFYYVTHHTSQHFNLFSLVAGRTDLENVVDDVVESIEDKLLNLFSFKLPVLEGKIALQFSA